MKKLIVFIFLSLLCHSSLAAIPYTFTNGTVSDATEVNANFTYFENKFSLTSGHDHDGSDSKATLKGEWQGTIVDEQYGGTGQSGYASGDLVYATSSTVLVRRALGARGSVLIVDAALSEPNWLAAGAAGTVLQSAGTTTNPTWVSNPVSFQGVYDGGKTFTANNGAIVMTKTDNTIAIDINRSAGSEGVVIDIDNDAQSSAIKLTQDGTGAPALFIDHNVAGGAIEIEIVSGTSGGHLTLTPVATNAGATEGMLYADTDGVLYYQSNSASQACNTASDFAEIMQCEGQNSDYKHGDVLVISNQNIEKAEYVSTLDDTEEIDIPDPNRPNKTKKEKVIKGKKKKILDDWFNNGAKKVTHSTTAYQTNVVGVFCEKASRLDYTMEVHKRLLVVSLIGLVKVNVCDEGGNIKAGDLLVTSSKKGYAMKGTIDSFNKIGSVIGKAREDFTFTPQDKTALIEMVVGVK